MTTFTTSHGRVQIRNSGLTLSQLRNKFARDLHAVNPLDAPTSLLEQPRKAAATLRTIKGLNSQMTAPEADEVGINIASFNRAHQRIMGIRS